MYSEEMYHYYTISKSAEQELMRATNELHLMYLHATDEVLKHDILLARFDIPKALWLAAIMVARACVQTQSWLLKVEAA